MARMLPGVVELASELTGLSGEESVNRFEWFNGLDTALYKAINLTFTSQNSYCSFVVVSTTHDTIFISPDVCVAGRFDQLPDGQ